MEAQELIQRRACGYGTNQGRPEEIIFLSQQGLNELQSHGIIPEKLSYDPGKTLRENSVAHQLLLNWFRIHLLQIDKMIPQVSTAFTVSLSSLRSPLFPASVTTHQGDNFFNDIIPDGIVTIKHNEEGKALLFFLEVDMNTETLASKSGNKNDIRTKIQRYQDVFRSEQYKCLEKVTDATFNGFRTLFLTNTEARFVALCNLVQETKKTEFVWLTDASMMFAYGLSATIWARGGNMNHPRESILGSKLAKETPLLIKVKN